MQGVYRIYLHARNRPFWKCPVPDSKDSVDVAVLRLHCVLSVSDLQPLRAISIVSHTWYSDYMHVLYRYVQVSGPFVFFFFGFDSWFFVCCFFWFLFLFFVVAVFFGRVMQRYERVKMRIIIVLSLVYYIVCINGYRYRYFEIKLKACKVNLT